MRGLWPVLWLLWSDNAAKLWQMPAGATAFRDFSWLYASADFFSFIKIFIFLIR